MSSTKAQANEELQDNLSLIQEFALCRELGIPWSVLDNEDARRVAIALEIMAAEAEAKLRQDR